MVIDKIRKMTVKGVKLKSESFLLMFPGVLELWRKNFSWADSAPPPAWKGHPKGPFTRSDFKDPILGSENWTQTFRLSYSKAPFLSAPFILKKSLG